jgi:hypothetical protein
MRENLQELDAAPGIFGIPPPNQADVSVVSARGIMILPAQYVPLLLKGRGYTVREIWELLLPLLVDDNQEDDCRPLIDWLRAASTANGVEPQTNRLLPPPFNLNFSGPPADEDLIAHRSHIMKLLLPGLSQLSEGLESAITTMATAIAHQTDEARSARESKQLEEDTPKLPSMVEKFKHTLPILLRLLELEDEADLPPLWHEWANCGKKQELAVFKDLLTTYAQGQHHFITKAPIVTPTLLQDIISFSFIGDHRDDVTTGLSPFNAIDGGEAHRKHSLELSKLQGTIYQNEVGFTLSDLDTLQKRELRTVPLCYFDLEKSLGLFGNLLGVVLGNTHTITSAYRQFWDLLSLSLRDELRDQIDVQHTIRPAHIVRSVQLVVHSWFSTRKLNGPSPPAPAFTDILARIQMSSYQLPGLPSPYSDLTYSVKPAGLHLSPPPSLSSSDVSSDMSTISGSTRPGHLPPTFATGPRPPPKPNGNTFVRNMAPDTNLQALIPAQFQLRTIIRNDPVPLNDANLPMCLSFHLRRGCWSQCKRAHDHNRNLSPGERQRVITFVTAQLGKMSASLPTVTRPPPPVSQGSVSGMPQGSQGAATGTAPSRG